MVLCFGTYANVLMKCALKGTTNRVMVSTLVSTIDPDNTYGDKNNDTPVSRLMNCDRDFPVVKVDPSDGPIRSVGGPQTNVVNLAKEKRPDEIEERFEPVIALLDEDKKAAAVGAMHYLIKSDPSLNGKHRALFVKCMGDTAARIVDAYEVNLRSFLARIFLYTVLINENTKGKESLAEIKDSGFINRFQAYAVLLRSPTDKDVEHPSASMPQGVRVYMRKLADKYDNLPTILHKEAFTPFRDYYVPNDVIWREKVPGERYAYRINREEDATLPHSAGHYALPHTCGLL